MINEPENYRDKLIRKLKNYLDLNRSNTEHFHQEVKEDERLEQFIISSVFIVVNELYVTVYFYLAFYLVILLNYFLYQ